MRKMTEDEWRSFVSHRTRTARLLTMRTDGSPQVTPVRFVLDGDDVVIQTGRDAVKSRDLARDGRFVLCVDDDGPPYAYVVLQGQAEEYAARTGGLIRAQIEKVTASAGVSEPTPTVP